MRNIIVAICLILAAFKLDGTFNINWIWVISPIWIATIFGFFGAVIVIVLGGARRKSKIDFYKKKLKELKVE